jgi:hypothetical protein
MKKEVNKDMENFRKQNQTEIMEMKTTFTQKKYSGRPFQQTRTSGKENISKIK